MKRLISRFLLTFLIIFSPFYAFNQSVNSSFKIVNPKKDFSSFKFKFLNNIIVFPIKINGDTSLNFIFDSGVENTLITNISYKDSVHFKSVELKRFYGLGENNYLDAFKSFNNVVEFKDIKNDNLFIYAIPMKIFDFSRIFKIDVQGVIGYDLFKDFIIEINYINNRIKFYNPKKYAPSRRKLSKYTKIPLEFEHSKPFINAYVVLENGNKIPVKLLIDTGGNFAVWLSSDSKKEIEPPKESAMAYLGETLSGEFFGLQAKIKSLDFGGYELLNPIAAFPDSNAISFIYKSDGRNGSIGTEVLRRFHLIFDYPNHALWVKPNAKFKDSYNFNGSGIELVPVSNDLFFKITYIDSTSPAFNAGLRKNHLVLQINNKLSKEYRLHEVYDLFRKSNGRTVKFHILNEDKLPIRKITVFFPSERPLKDVRKPRF